MNFFKIGGSQTLYNCSNMLCTELLIQNYNKRKMKIKYNIRVK